MPPPRHVPPTPDELLAPVERDEFTESVLDAAMAEFREFGLRRASIDSVAERLGVGRTTVYRRFGGKEALIQAVMLRETKRYLAGVRKDTGGGSVHDRVVEGFRAGVARNRERQLLQALLQREPLVVMPYILGEDAGRLLEYATTRTYEALKSAPDAAEYTGESLYAVATSMERLAHSMANAPPRGGIGDKNLRSMARDLLIPLLAVRSAQSGTPCE